MEELIHKIRDYIRNIYKAEYKNRLEVKFENGIYTLLLGVPNDLIPTTISLQTNDPQEFLDFIYEELRTRNYMRTYFYQVRRKDTKLTNMKYSEKEQDLIECIDKAITELVYEKVKLIKAYNYYHGKRDPEQFRHLEENYGIGTPTSVEFVPLVRKHVDVLVGEYLTIPVVPKVSCKDEKTLSE